MSNYSEHFFESIITSEGICFESDDETLSIDLGSGLQIANPFNASNVQGVDIISDKNIITADLFHDNLPLGDESVDFVTAFDFFEHVPRVICNNNKTSFRFIELMSDILRVLKPGGYLFSHTPAFPSPAAFQDPTHVNIITDLTFPEYFCRRPNKWLPSRQGKPGGSRYGFKDEYIFCCQKMYGTHLLTLLQKPAMQD